MNKPILYNVLLQFNYPKIPNPYLLITTYMSDPNVNIGETIAIRGIKVGFEQDLEPALNIEIANKVFNFDVKVVEIKKAIVWRKFFNVNIIVKVENQESIKGYILAWDKLYSKDFIEHIEKIGKEVGID